MSRLHKSVFLMNGPLLIFLTFKHRNPVNGEIVYLLAAERWRHDTPLKGRRRCPYAQSVARLSTKHNRAVITADQSASREFAKAFRDWLWWLLCYGVAVEGGASGAAFVRQSVRCFLRRRRSLRGTTREFKPRPALGLSASSPKQVRLISGKY